MNARTEMKNNVNAPEKVAEKAEVLTMSKANAEKLAQKITNAYEKADKTFLGIAGDIAKARDYKIHKTLEYDCNFYEFCREMWGIGATSVKNMVALVERFGNDYKIADRWNAYGTRKLLVISKLDDETLEHEIEVEHITPDMRVSDLEDYVKRLLGLEVETPEAIEDNEGGSGDADDEYTEERKGMKVDVDGDIFAQIKKLLNIDDDIDRLVIDVKF